MIQNRSLPRENEIDQSSRSQHGDALIRELLQPEMPLPSGLLIQELSGAESERTESDCLTRDFVEACVCQFAVEAPQ